MQLAKETDKSMTSAEITDLVHQTGISFGIAPEDIAADVSYSTSGVLDIVIPEGIEAKTVVKDLEESLAEVLDIHEKDINVEYDEITGEMTYTISSDKAENLTQINPELENSVFADKLQESLENNVVVERISVGDIQADVAITIDGDKSANLDTVNYAFGIGEEFVVVSSSGDCNFYL